MKGHAGPEQCAQPSSREHQETPQQTRREQGSREFKATSQADENRINKQAPNGTKAAGQTVRQGRAQDSAETPPGDTWRSEPASSASASPPLEESFLRRLLVLDAFAPAFLALGDSRTSR